MDVLPELSLGTSALIIFGVCAIYMLLRGLARTFVNTAFLLISAWIAFRVWQEAPSLSMEWIGKQSQIITTGLPILAGIAALVILRKVFKILFRNPFGSSGEENEEQNSPSILTRLLFTLIPAGLICLTAAAVLRHASSIAEVKNSAENGIDSKSALAERIKHAISLATPQSLMDKLDPMTTEPRVRLAKMIASSQKQDLEPIIDPETGQPYPRAIIVDNPELASLAKEGDFSTLLRHPLLTEALKDPLVRKTLGLSH